MPNFEYQNKEPNKNNQETYRPGEHSEKYPKKVKSTLIENAQSDTNADSGTERTRKRTRYKNRAESNHLPPSSKTPQSSRTASKERSSTSLLSRLVDKIKLLLGNNKKRRTGKQSQVRPSHSEKRAGRRPTPRTAENEEPASMGEKRKPSSRPRGGRKRGRKDNSQGNSNRPQDSTHKSGNPPRKRSPHKTRSGGSHDTDSSKSSTNPVSSQISTSGDSTRNRIPPAKASLRRESTDEPIPSPSQLAAMHTKKPVRDYRNTRKKRVVKNEFKDQRSNPPSDK